MSISPYFEDNLYSNDPYGKAYFIWSYSAPNDELSEEYPDIVVTDEYIEKFESEYDIHVYNAHMIFKLEEVEMEPYIVYVKKQI